MKTNKKSKKQVTKERAERVLTAIINDLLRDKYESK